MQISAIICIVAESAADSCEHPRRPVQLPVIERDAEYQRGRVGWKFNVFPIF